ncbi:uncharacterized protein LOC123258243 [Drosophila ananassae]|uniref:uncharacterized protein LOC123258243 n=1 Tax=Drosophila ananassae TaxID=7217 RepID=UPI001CFF724B|nr:uncharacterized protein LOC123258243 [Drosophila ananassae]
MPPPTPVSNISTSTSLAHCHHRTDTDTASPQSVANALISGWFSLYGIPLHITTELGRQFESTLFQKLAKICGFKHLRTTAYHPQANWMVERWHRTLKAALKSADPLNWSSSLHLILLGLRTTVKSDIGLSPAEMVYGTALRIPVGFFTPNTQKHTESEIAETLQKTISQLPTTKPVHHHTPQEFENPDLNHCTRVFVRVDRVKTPLEANYEGPFEMLAKHDKYFTLKGHTKDIKVSIDRPKPAYISKTNHLRLKRKRQHQLPSQPSSYQDQDDESDSQQSIFATVPS